VGASRVSWSRNVDYFAAMHVSIERDLDLLERSLVGLKIEYERFFAGDLKVPPTSARRKIGDILRRVGNVEIDRAAEQFRLQAIQGRFMSMSELWDKRVAAREEGRRSFRASRAAAAEAPPAKAPPAPPVEAPPAPARRPKSVSSDGEGSTSVKAVGRGDLKSLFDRFCAERAAAGEDVSKLRYDRFEVLVKKQAAEIRRATGATRLAFEVQTRDGKVRLVGRPLPAPVKETP
jgi:hypothetical protein